MYVAVKIIKYQEELKGNEFDALVNEIEVLHACKSPFIVQFLGASVSEQETIIVTELMEGGSLQRALQAGAITWSKR